MTDSNATTGKSAPFHLWIVGIVGTLWSAMGATDYVMTQTHNEAYMGGFTPEQLDFFYGLPTWTVAAWAIAVWGGVLGALMLLLRTGHAVNVLLASFAAMVVTSFQNFVLSNGLEVMGGGFELAFSGLIFLVALGLYLYARAMAKKGILA